MMTTKTRKQTKLWTMRDGDQMRICDMTDSHLLNAMKMLKRVAIDRKSQASRDSWSALSMLSGEMASYYAEQECDQVDETHWEEWTGGFWEPMLLDAERRGGATLEAARGLCR